MTKTTNKSNEKIKILSEEKKKEVIDNLTFNSVAVEFKNGKFEKYIVNKYMLSSEDQKAFKGEAKAIKNIDFVTNIEYSENAKSVEKIKKFHYVQFKDNMLKFTKNDFDKILASVNEDLQLAIFKKILLDYSKQKNVSVKLQQTFVSGAKTLIRRFIIAILTEYCKG